MDKQTARGIVRSYLDAISDEQYVTLSGVVCKNVETLLDRLYLEGKADSVLLYTARSQWREIPLIGLDKKYPKSKFEYVSPRKNARFPAGKYSVIFVPLLGFNEGGYRLGHGGGWYDMFLSTQPQAVKIGVGLECGHVDVKPESHDIPLDLIVTEKNNVTQ